jgi:phosphotransferase system HPr (HPr) family protein
VVNLENGLHLVPCSQIAKVARRYACDVRLTKDGRVFDAKEVLDLMTLSAERGAELLLEASGEGAAEVVEELGGLFDSNFESLSAQDVDEDPSTP